MLTWNEPSKIRHEFTKWSSLKIIRIKNAFTESCSSNLIFWRENCFHKNQIGVWPPKMILKFTNAQILLLYFQILVTFGGEITIHGWLVFKTTPLIECATCYKNFKVTLCHIIHLHFCDILFYSLVSVASSFHILFVYSEILVHFYLWGSS